MNVVWRADARNPGTHSYVIYNTYCRGRRDIGVVIYCGVLARCLRPDNSAGCSEGLVIQVGLHPNRLIHLKNIILLLIWSLRKVHRYVLL